MINVLFRTILNQVGLTTYILGFLGFFLAYRRKKNLLIIVNICIIAFMLLWRAVLKIGSPRYSAILVYFFVAYAAYSVHIYKTKHVLLRLITSIVIVIMPIVSIYKTLRPTKDGLNIKVVAEYLSELEKKEKISIYTQDQDFTRIKFYSRIPIMDMYSAAVQGSAQDFINHYVLSKRFFILDYISDSKDKLEFKKTINRQHKFLLSVFTQRNKKKRHNVIKIDTGIVAHPISKKQIVYNQTNLLENGDFEKVDTPEASLEENKKHIPNYSSFYSFDSGVRTPYNAYFHNAASDTAYLPFYNCSTENPIEGLYSVKMNVQRMKGYVFFYQSFPAKDYLVSFLAKGTQGTKISLLYDYNMNKRWNMVTLIDHIIETPATYYLETTLRAADQKEFDSFLLGVAVQNGEAILDHFTVLPLDKK